MWLAYRPWLRLILLISYSLTAAIAHPSLAQAQEDAEDLTIRGMCRAGLTASALNYVSARRELEIGDASAAARWTMRLMECHAFGALHSRSEAEQHWNMCESVFRDFVASDPTNPRLPWLAWQLSRCHLLRAQSELALYLAAPANSQPREKSLELVRTILGELEKLDDDIRQRQPLAARQVRSADTQAPVEQLHKLAVDVELMRCEALLIRTRLYVRGSLDRIASATDVDRQATEVLQRTEPNWPSRAQLEVAGAAARLELGRSAEALLQLEALVRSSNNRQARIRAATVAIEYMAAHRQISRAQALLALLRDAGAGPEIDLAEIELAIAEVGTKSEGAKQRALAELVEQSRQLGARYGDYWRSRGEALLIGSIGVESVASDSTVAVDLVTVEVRQLLAAGNERAAIQKLLQLRDNQAAAGRGQLAIEAALQAAALAQRQQDWLTAIDILAPFSSRFPDAEGAAEAHLQAIVCAAQALREDAGNQDLQQQYESLLREQLTTWPTAAASEESEQWLANWLTVKGRSEELADALLSRSAAATDATIESRSLMRWLGTVLNLEELEAQLRQLARLDAIIGRNGFVDGQSVASLVQLFAQVAIVWPSEKASAEQIRALARLESPDAPAELQQLAIAIRLLSKVRRNDAAGIQSEPLSFWEPELLVPAVREGLAIVLVEAIDETPLPAHGEWARRLKLDRAWLDMLLRSHSVRSQAAGFRILAWTEDPTAALDGLASLAEKAMRSGGALQLQLANAFADSGPNRLESSSRIARVLVANSPVGSELNLAARWRLIKNQLALGKHEEAREAAQLLLATQPLESEIWKGRLESVAK